MSPRLSRILLLAYPPSWRRRYASELQALLEDGRPASPSMPRVVMDVLLSGGGEWVRAAWRSAGRTAMARTVLFLSALGAAFIYLSTMTGVSYDSWVWLNGIFGLAVTFTVFVRAGKAGWLHGFAAGSISIAIFVAILVTWVSAAGDRLVQLPFDHFDVASRGSVRAYLAGPGLGEFVRGAIAAGVLGIVLSAVMAWAGAATAQLNKRLSETA